MRSFLIIAACLLAGCAPTVVEPLALLEGQTNATLLREGEDNVPGEVIGVADLSRILARATWIDEQPFHKGGHWIRFSGGTEVFIPYVIPFVMVRGTEGHFVIRPEDRKRYEVLAKRIHAKANKPAHDNP